MHLYHWEEDLFFSRLVFDCTHLSKSAHILVLICLFVFQISTVGKPKMFIFTNAQVKPSFEMLVAISTALQPSNVHKRYNNCIILIHQIHKWLILLAATVLTACVVVQGKRWHWLDSTTGRLWVDSCANTSYSVQQCWNVNTKYDFSQTYSVTYAWKIKCIYLYDYVFATLMFLPQYFAKLLPSVVQSLKLLAKCIHWDHIVFFFFPSL